jgi:hypothetical protein
LPGFFETFFPPGIFSAASRGKICRVAINAECLRECPENPRVQDESLGRTPIDRQIICNLAAEAAVLIVDRVLEPEGKNVGSELRFNPIP